MWRAAKRLRLCRSSAPTIGGRAVAVQRENRVWTGQAKLLADLVEVESSLNYGQWKAATVLGGSLIKALLLEKLERLKPGKLAKSPHYQKTDPTWQKQLHAGFGSDPNPAPRVCIPAPITAPAGRPRRCWPP